MTKGEAFANTLVDELNSLGLPNMAATLDSLYHSEQFLQLDHLSLISALIEPEYRDKVSKRINNRLRHAKLIGCPENLSKCADSTTREYLPKGITSVLESIAKIQIKKRPFYHRRLADGKRITGRRPPQTAPAPDNRIFRRHFLDISHIVNHVVLIYLAAIASVTYTDILYFIIHLLSSYLLDTPSIAASRSCLLFAFYRFEKGDRSKD